MPLCSQHGKLNVNVVTVGRCGWTSEERKRAKYEVTIRSNRFPWLYSNTSAIAIIVISDAIDLTDADKRALGTHAWRADIRWLRAWLQREPYKSRSNFHSGALDSTLQSQMSWTNSWQIITSFSLKDTKPFTIAFRSTETEVTWNEIGRSAIKACMW